MLHFICVRSRPTAIHVDRPLSSVGAGPSSHRAVTFNARLNIRQQAGPLNLTCLLASCCRCTSEAPGAGAARRDALVRASPCYIGRKSHFDPFYDRINVHWQACSHRSSSIIFSLSLAGDSWNVSRAISPLILSFSLSHHAFSVNPFVPARLFSRCIGNSFFLDSPLLAARYPIPVRLIRSIPFH